MIDRQLANVIKPDINRVYKEIYGENQEDIVNIDDVRRMDEIQISEDGGYAILAIQKKHITILVKVKQQGKHTYTIPKVEFVEWN